MTHSRVPNSNVIATTAPLASKTCQTFQVAALLPPAVWSSTNWPQTTAEIVGLRDLVLQNLKKKLMTTMTCEFYVPDRILLSVGAGLGNTC
jgi:hypothetical protein